MGTMERERHRDLTESALLTESRSWDSGSRVPVPCGCACLHGICVLVCVPGLCDVRGVLRGFGPLDHHLSPLCLPITLPSPPSLPLALSITLAEAEGERDAAAVDEG